MAHIPAQRVKILVDGPALRFAALQAAAVSMGTFPNNTTQVLGRAERFLGWLEKESLEVKTFWGEDDDDTVTD
jgi:uncharacterized protein YmfQ (DUF2313 family)